MQTTTEFPRIIREADHSDNESSEQMSMEAIRDYFQRRLEKIDHYFNQNPSYVFLKRIPAALSEAAGL